MNMLFCGQDSCEFSSQNEIPLEGPTPLRRETLIEDDEAMKARRRTILNEYEKSIKELRQYRNKLAAKLALKKDE